MNMPIEQTQDPTEWRYPDFWSPNRTIHIHNLEAEIARLVARDKRLDQSTLDHCKAWIDYRCSDLRSGIGPLDAKGAAQDLDVDKAMRVSVHNTLINLRLQFDNPATPEKYPPATQTIYIHDADMQRLRNPYAGDYPLVNQSKENKEFDDKMRSGQGYKTGLSSPPDRPSYQEIIQHKGET